MPARRVITAPHVSVTGRECPARGACRGCLAVRASRAAAAALLTVTATDPTTAWALPEPLAPASRAGSAR